MNEDELVALAAALLRQGASRDEVEAILAEKMAGAQQPERPAGLTPEQKTDARLRMFDDDAGPAPMTAGQVGGMLANAAQGSTFGLAGKLPVIGDIIDRAAQSFAEEQPGPALAAEVVGLGNPLAVAAKIGKKVVGAAGKAMRGARTERAVSQALRRTGQTADDVAARAEGSANRLEALGPAASELLRNLPPLADDVAGEAFRAGQAAIDEGKGELGRALIRAARRKEKGNLFQQAGQKLGGAAGGAAIGAAASENDLQGGVTGALLGSVGTGLLRRGRARRGGETLRDLMRQTGGRPASAAPPVDDLFDRIAGDIARREAEQAVRGAVPAAGKRGFGPGLSGGPFAKDPTSAHATGKALRDEIGPEAFEALQLENMRRMLRRKP